MQTGRPDLDAIIKGQGIPANEPVFFLRGQDQLAAATVRAWASLAAAAGVDAAAVESALQQADDMEAWPTKKLPDGPHLEEAERKQRVYELARRAWDARKDVADPRILLAEERAFGALLGRLRPILADLFENGQLLPDGSFIYTPPGADAGPRYPASPIALLKDLRAALEPHVGMGSAA